MGYVFKKGKAGETVDCFIDPSKNNLIVARVCLDFINDWNHLMPVVEKIERLGWIVEIAIHECEIFEPYERSEEITKGKSKIDAVYQAVVKFINWYNKNYK